MNLERLTKELSDYKSKYLKGRTIRKILVEKGETVYAIQIVFAESISNKPSEITFFAEVDNTEIIDFEEE